MKQSGNGGNGPALRMLLEWPKNQPPYPTSLVERCEMALDRPLEQQTPETLRLLIGQQIGLELLLTKALDLLEENVLTSGDLYAGDLLAACQRVSADFWAWNPDLWVRLNGVLEDFDRTVEQVNKHRQEFLSRNPFGAKL